MRPLPRIINGAIAGFTAAAAVFPLDLVKTRLQKQQASPGAQKMYNNMMDVFVKTYKAEGIPGLYRGISVTVWFVAAEKAYKLVSNDFFRYHLGEKYGYLPLYKQVLAGSLAGFTQCVITTPSELLKIQLQDWGRRRQKAELAGKTVEKITAFQLVLDVFRKYGIFGMYKGVSPTILRDCLFSGVHFPTFAAINALGPKRKDGTGDSLFWWSLFAGFVSGALSAFVVTPFDVIKTRLQTVVAVEGERTYTGVRDAYRKILKYEGPTAFFKGGVCRVMVIGPLFGITQAVFYLGVAEYLLGIEKK